MEINKLRLALDEEVNTKNRLADDRRRLKMEHKRVKEMLEKEVNEYKKQFQDDKMSRVELERYLIYINYTYPTLSKFHIFIISLPFEPHRLLLQSQARQSQLETQLTEITGKKFPKRKVQSPTTSAEQQTDIDMNMWERFVREKLELESMMKEKVLIIILY